MNSESAKAPGILDGIRVIECGVYLAGPLGAALLGDLGAEVIKVEVKGQGDPYRGMKTDGGVDMMLPDGKQLYFEYLNRNKRGIAIDLKQEAGKKILYQLVAKSDVFISNLRLKGLKRLGLDYDTLVQYNPKLVYVSGSGYGMKGPDSDEASHDLMGMARSGIMMWGLEDDMAPVEPPRGICDALLGEMIAHSAIAGLFARERKGIGQNIHASHLGSTIALMGPKFWLAGAGKVMTRPDRTKPFNAGYSYYRCKDGKYVSILLAQEKQWVNFCKVIGLPHLEKDPRFENYENRRENAMALMRILDVIFATKSSREWEQSFKGSSIPFSPVYTIPEVLSDPQVIENEYITKFDHPTLGRIGLPGLGFNTMYTRTPARLASWAPELGQHTEEVLVEILGYGWDDIGELKEAGVI
ncbi:MAG: CoA transferase [Chloroflexi bacterium]|nr:CoA transferase [Chloroflexota bacterium]